MNGLLRQAIVGTLRTRSRIACAGQCANMTSIAVFPPSSFIDDTVSVVVSGLAPNTRVSLRSSVQDRDKVFQAVGHFEADGDGKVDLNAQQSLGGSYTGPGPFPAVIDMFGLAGGVIEYRAAMLASKGIIALALPYFSYEDLPRSFHHLEFEYFEEATAWLSSQSFVSPNATGIVGTSFGGSIALEMAARLPQIKAVVATSCLPFFKTLLTYRGERTPSSHPPVDPEKGYMSKEGFAMKEMFTEDVCNLPDEELIDMQNSEARFLFVLGEDDQNVPAAEGARRTVQKMQSHNKTNYELLSYKGAGHLLEPPFQPAGRGIYNAPLDHVLDFGGEMKAHAHACQDVWSKTLSFLRRHLMTTEGDGHQLTSSSRISKL
ncbi:acyl-coenzyme A amino acid N-acyltransferase 2-like isoform X2 [Patiria miniata]|uniref:BAAT/Acyl-CoA thioester hydrolase C-terminal domain-containing protein n=1 Tax=Patiria miniata TaxID=46514 RepID=A0A914BE53_PATMI|nr:acyl-coenzyme A amino acid N-acyltransferase 2-like isoform X2 [Patiria miniata]